MTIGAQVKAIIENVAVDKGVLCCSRISDGMVEKIPRATPQAFASKW